MSCYLTHGYKKHFDKNNDGFFEDIFKHKDHKKREKNKPRLNRAEVLRLIEEEY